MFTTSLDIVLMAILPAFLVAAAVWDLTSFTIPNLLLGGMAVLFVVVVGLLHLTGHAIAWSEIGLHAGAGLLGLIVGIALFAPGWIGGGDAKLFAVASLWLGWNALFQYALVASLFGGVLTFLVILLRGTPLPGPLVRQDWIVRLADKKSGVPYGIALAIACLVLLPRTDLFRLVAG